MKQYLLLLFIMIGSVLLFVTGCSEKQKLTGKVTFPDGKPLQFGTIYFASETYLARAVLKNDGTYNVGSLGEKDGLPPGKYKVYIVGAIMEGEPVSVTVSTAPATGGDETSTPSKNDIYPVIPLIDNKFTKPETTPLEITIPDTKTFDFSVEAPIKK